jgi:hypothetical protein
MQAYMLAPTDRCPSGPSSSRRVLLYCSGAAKPGVSSASSGVERQRLARRTEIVSTGVPLLRT